MESSQDVIKKLYNQVLIAKYKEQGLISKDSELVDVFWEYDGSTNSARENDNGAK